MFIQTDDAGKVLSAMEATFTDSDGNEVEQITDGYFEVETCQTVESLFVEGYDTYYIDGMFKTVDNGSEARRASATTLDDVADALADISETVSSGAEDMQTVNDAIAELSELVASLIPTEGE